MLRLTLNSIVVALAALVALVAPLAFAETAGNEAKRVGDPYPLDACPVSGEKLGSMGEPVVRLHDGREVRLCCEGCIEKFEADPAAHYKKIDEQIIKQQAKDYPATTCPVSGKKLDAMGKPFQLVHGNRLVQLCCKGCLNRFNSEPAQYINKLDAAVIEAQLASYPLETCVIGGGKLGSMGEPFNAVYANQLVRFCCAGCGKGFEKNLPANLAKIAEARKLKVAEAVAEPAAAPAAAPADNHGSHAGHNH